MNFVSISVLRYLRFGLEKGNRSISNGIVIQQEGKQENDLLALGKSLQKGSLNPVRKNWEHMLTIGRGDREHQCIKEWQAILRWKKRICLYTCSVSVRQCQILHLQVQIHNYIHTTLGCLFKPCMYLSFFQRIMSDCWIFCFFLGKLFSMGFVSDIIQCNFIFCFFSIK